MKIENIDLSDLNHLVGNPRVISKDAKERLKGSIRRWGLFKPLLIWSDEDGVTYVIGGNKRFNVLSALQADGDLPMDVTLKSGAQVVVSSEIPCVRFHGDRAEARAVALRDNVSDGEWDWQALPEFLHDLEQHLPEDLEDLDALTGFDDATLKDLRDLFDDPEVGMNRYTSTHDDQGSDGGDGDGKNGEPDDGKGNKRSDDVSRKHARFRCGTVSCNLPIPVYRRLTKAFDQFGRSENTTDLPRILTALMDAAGVEEVADG